MIESSSIKHVLEDSSFKEAMENLKQMHMDMIINSDVDEKVAREICYLRITTINEILSHLESIASDEKIDKKRWKI